MDFGFLISKFCLGLGGLYRGRGDQRDTCQKIRYFGEFDIEM